MYRVTYKENGSKRMTVILTGDSAFDVCNEFLKNKNLGREIIKVKELTKRRSGNFGSKSLVMKGRNQSLHGELWHAKKDVEAAILRRKSR